MNESTHMKCTIHLCGIFRQVIFVNVRFFVNFVNFVTSVYQYYFFYVISLWFIGDEQRSQKEKWEESCACFINQVRSGCFFVFFFCQGNFLTKCKEYIIYFFISPLNSQIKFVILLTVNHTILIM